MRQNARRVMQFAEKLNISYPIIAGTAQTAQPFGPKGYPTSILYNVAGNQVLFKEGTITRQEIEEVLNRGNMN